MNEITARAILFDVDGVLVDSVDCLTRQWKLWADGRGLEWRKIVALAHGRRPVETIRIVAPQLDAAAEAARISASEEEDMVGVRPVPGAQELIRSLGGIPWAIVTSGTRRLATNRMRHVGLPPPGVIVSADDVVHGKPDPECYLKAAAKLGVVPPEAVAIEDSPAGLEAARRARVRVIGVASTHDASALTQADLVVGSLVDLKVELRRDGHAEAVWLHS